MSEAADRWSVRLEGTTLLGRYTVERQIGGGGMANVYLAKDDQLDQAVVVKVPHVAFLAEQGFRERFERETRDLSSLQHPHIVRILARGEHEGIPFLVLPFLPGGSLGDRMRKAKGEGLPFEQVRPWIRDVARALDFIHERGIVHRDIKPDNVLFDEHGYVYLSDFGIAKTMSEADTGLTATGTTPGSPAYMAPEQPRVSKLTGASDQYSLAATIYEALSGHPAFEGETAVDVLIKKQSESPKALTELVPDLPRAAGAAVMRGLARDPEGRFPHCGALAEAMLGTVEAAPAEAESTATATSAPAAAVRHAPEGLPQAVPPAVTKAAPRAASARPAKSGLWIGLGLAALTVGAVLFFFTGNRARAPSQAPATKDSADDPTARLVGEYELDAALLRKRLKRPGGPRKRRPPRGMPRGADLENMLSSGVQLLLMADGRFRLQIPARTERLQNVEGSWKRADEFVVFQPDSGFDKALPAKALEPFRARIGPAGLDLLRLGFELPFRRR